MTHDCYQSQGVFLQKITLTCWLTLSLCFYLSYLLLFKFFNRDLNNINYYNANFLFRYLITVKKYIMAARMQAVARHRRPFLL